MADGEKVISSSSGFGKIDHEIIEREINDSSSKRQPYAASNRGLVITRGVSVSTAKVLMARNPHLIGNVDVEPSHWAQSLYRRMGFRRRQATTSKLEISEGALKEIKLLFHQIASKVKIFSIPHSLIISQDQTPTKCVLVGRTTLAKKNTKTVPIKGSSDKRTITATFAISLQWEFLPMQLIYGGKIRKCLPRFKFPEKISFSYNETHYSNDKEACKFTEDVCNHKCIQRSGDTNGSKFIQRIQYRGCASSCKHDEFSSAIRFDR